MTHDEILEIILLLGLIVILMTIGALLYEQYNDMVQ